MKTGIFLFFFLLTLQIAAQPSITGDWSGKLKLPGGELTIVYHIKQDGTDFKSTFDSPDQHARGIPVDETVISGDSVFLTMKAIGITYRAKVEKNKLTGNFYQPPYKFPLELTRGAGVEKVVRKPQEPVEPFPYHAEDVTFQNVKDGFPLTGTLTLPRGKENVPVVVLISGSGPQDRNSEIAGHKPFLVIADHLARNGIGTLRYDDRGVGHSQGVFTNATTADFAADAAAALDFLRANRSKYNLGKIGIAGHSEGGLIAPVVATEYGPADFVILLAGPALRGDQILLLQQVAINTGLGGTPEQVAAAKKTFTAIFKDVIDTQDEEALEGKIRTQLEAAGAGATTDKVIADIVNPWMLHFLRHDPAPYLTRLRVPVLALFGSLDTQILPKENTQALKKLVKPELLTVKEFKGLNHLFQPAKTGMPQEYGEIKQTISPEVLTTISSWISAQCK